jgi:hypothetical protein
MGPMDTVSTLHTQEVHEETADELLKGGNPEDNNMENDLTDLSDNPTPTRQRGLTRSYAIANLDAPVQTEGKYDRRAPKDNDYDPPTELERDTSIEANDDPTPKKKQKIVKVPVREAIKASCKEPTLHHDREQNEVNTPSEASGRVHTDNNNNNDCLIRFVMSQTHVFISNAIKSPTDPE